MSVMALYPEAGRETRHLRTRWGLRREPWGLRREAVPQGGEGVAHLLLAVREHLLKRLCTWWDTWMGIDLMRSKDSSFSGTS